jgi:Zn-dependent M28 family amino/carboxypeptidase
LARTREFIADELKSFGLNVSFDEFQASTPEGPKKMVNIVAELPGESLDAIMVTSHYDTKLYREFRFVGANDGASSTAAVMEIARAMAATKSKPKYTYWFVLFDGEEAFCKEWDDCRKPGAPDNTYGSRHFLAKLEEKKEVDRVRAMILLDMIGYKSLTIPRESYSTPWLTRAIWETASELGYGNVFIESSEEIEDDHLAYLQRGIDAVDLIQLSGYPYWHEAEDTLDKISPQSLKIVGDVVIASLPRIEQHLLAKRR